MEWNRIEWNEMEWNRMEWNEMEWNGIEWILLAPTSVVHFLSLTCSMI
jgi:hypothetical protein